MTEKKSALTFIPESLPAFTLDEPKQFDIEVSGGTPPYSSEITQGEPPESLNLSDEGRISGTVTETPATTVWVKVTDADGSSLTQAFDVQIVEP